MKNLKSFETEAEYLEYMESEEVELPNVSVIGDDDVRFTPLVFPTYNNMVIDGLDSTTGQSCMFIAVCDNTHNVTSYVSWSVISGETYANITRKGVLRVKEGVVNQDVTIQADFNGLTATKTVNVTYEFGTITYTGSNVFVDESGYTNTAISSYTFREDGTYDTGTRIETFDESGNTIGASESETHVEEDGSATGIATEYDADGNVYQYTNMDWDTEGNLNTSVVDVDDEGNETVVEYGVDTSGNLDTGYELIDNPTDTLFMPFVGTDGFELTMHFYAKYEEQPNPPIVPDPEDKNYLYHIISAKSATRPWPGFVVRFTSSDTSKIYISRTMSGQTSSTNVGFAKKQDGIYNFKFVYDPSLSTGKFKCYDMMDNETLLFSENRAFSQLEDMSVTLGYGISQEGTPYRYSNVRVYAFRVRKLDRT